MEFQGLALRALLGGGGGNVQEIEKNLLSNTAAENECPQCNW